MRKNVMKVSGVLMMLIPFCPLAQAKAGESGKVLIPSNCLTLANQQLVDTDLGWGPLGAAAFLNEKGATKIPDSSAIVRHDIKSGAETIVYRIPLGNALVSPNTDQVMADRTIVINRDSQGRVLEISRIFDLDSQVRATKQSTQRGLITESVKSRFSYQGRRCSLEQTVAVQKIVSSESMESIVYFDREFCDRTNHMIHLLAPTTVNANVLLIEKAQALFEQRNTELAQKGMSLKEYPELDAQSGFSKRYSVGVAVQLCSANQALTLMAEHSRIQTPWSQQPSTSFVSGRKSLGNEWF